MTVLFDALEQFDIFSFPCSSILISFSVWFTNLHVTHLIAICTVFVFFYFSAPRKNVLALNWKRHTISSSFNDYSRTPAQGISVVTLFYFVLESLYMLISSLLRDNILQKKSTNLGFVFFLFLNLIIFNLIGLFPFTFTVTSSFVVTLFFSLTVFLAANIMGLYYNGFKVLANFLPTGTPLFIAPLLVLIEIVSYFSRIFSLSIRLFANMMSGHGLLKILIGFSFLALKTFEMWFWLGLLPWIVVAVVLVLEVAIAFLQAYVFIILTAIYINDAINPH